MNDTEFLLRSIPHVDRLLRSETVSASELPCAIITGCVRNRLAEIRKGILAGKILCVPSAEEITAACLEDAREEYRAGIRGLVNATGVILHSNLGRACISARAAKAVEQAAKGFTNLEYDLKSGSRGSRVSVSESLLMRLTGAQSAIVVNNNAAAVLLILTALCSGGSVVISRGELVEIGGSFRMPDIMEQCSCRLREVGTTNKTRASDYESAIDENTKAVLKVHTSNYRIIGFTESADIKSLSKITREHGIPLIDDIGSCSLIDLEKYGIIGEPGASASLKDGADVVCFSGDKLLGGPQAGIILGGRRYLSKMKNHALYRALRVDKMTLAALEETLRAYFDVEEARSELPVLAMLTAGIDEIREKAEHLRNALAEFGSNSEIIPVMSAVGSGSIPGREIDSLAVSPELAPEVVLQLDRRLRMLPRPIVGRIAKNRYLLDMRTVFDSELEYTARAVSAQAALCEGKRQGL